jgi:hypothetical protein
MVLGHAFHAHDLISRGLTARDKILRVEGVTEDHLRASLLG